MIGFLLIFFRDPDVSGDDAVFKKLSKAEVISVIKHKEAKQNKLGWHENQ